METVRAAVFDSGSLYAFARLSQLGEMAQEPLELEDLPIIERYVRSYVLHDESHLMTPAAVDYVNPNNVEDLKRSVTDGMRDPRGNRVEIRSALLRNTPWRRQRFCWAWRAPSASWSFPVCRRRVTSQTGETRAALSINS